MDDRVADVLEPAIGLAAVPPGAVGVLMIERHLRSRMNPINVGASQPIPAHTEY